jgi:hypothetical protein
MKILTVKNVLAAAILPLLSSASFALTVSTPMSLDDPIIIGTINPITPGNSLAQNVDKVNFLLALVGADGVLVTGDDADSRHYETKHAGYSGSVTDVGGASEDDADEPGNNVVPAGFDIVEAKYGPGVVVFYAGGQSLTLPTSSADFIFANGGQPSGLSDWRAYDGDPEDPIVPPEGIPTPDGGATMLLLGGGISALALLRRKVS